MDALIRVLKIAAVVLLAPVWIPVVAVIALFWVVAAWAMK
jgi:hypothetical protein